MEHNDIPPPAHDVPPPASSSVFSLRFGLLPSDFADVPRPRPSPVPRRRALSSTDKLPPPKLPVDDFDGPPEQFLLLGLLAHNVARLWRWSVSGQRSPFQAPTPAAIAALPMPVDPQRHRYPFCLVWTPIHPLTWIAPYVGHVGLCTSDGVVLDFATNKHVGRDKMAFGWPARYLQLSPALRVGEELNWEGEIERATLQFRRVEYNFLTWNW